MRDQAQQWIAMSNREESMARVLSRSDFHDGAELHAARAASASLIAVLANHGWPYTSDRCQDLCHLLEAHDMLPPQDVFKAALTLDERAAECALNHPPKEDVGQPAAAECLDCVQTIRSFVNAALTKA
jgi:HEPN domain-containing protein